MRSASADRIPPATTCRPASSGRGFIPSPSTRTTRKTRSDGDSIAPKLLRPPPGRQPGTGFRPVAKRRKAGARGGFRQVRRPLGDSRDRGPCLPARRGFGRCPGMRGLPLGLACLDGSRCGRGCTACRRPRTRRNGRRGRAGLRARPRRGAGHDAVHPGRGRCGVCIGGDPTACPGQHVLGFSGHGAFAERVAVPRADFNLIRQPDTLDPVDAAGMGCRITTAFRALVDRAQLGPGERLAAWLRRGRPVRDQDSGRRRRACRARQLSLHGTRGIPARRLSALFAMIEAGRLTLEGLVTRRIPLEDAGAALAAMDSGQPPGVTVIDGF